MTTPVDRPWTNQGLPLETRLDLILAEMTLDELVGQLHQTPNLDPVRDADLITSGGVGSTLYASGATAGNERDAGAVRSTHDAVREVASRSRLGIPPLIARDVIHGHRTIYPIPLGMAATWDLTLAEESAALAARESLADGIDWTFAPMIDIAEDPRWGRVAESLGESPVLAGRLGAAMVRGFQQTGTFAATAKHFVGYGIARGGRDYASASVGENTLRNLHLRPFREAVDAGCATVMAAFTDVDGIPMHAHAHLLRNVLKGEWGFDGVVVADWDGIGELVQHGVAADLRDAARQAIEAGVDIDMVTGAYSAHLAELVTSGVVDRDLVVDAARRVLRLKFRLGLFDAPPTPAPQSAPVLDRDLARRAAAASLVLVKNNGVLPLDRTSSVHLTGPFVDEGEALLGTWVLDGDGSEVARPADSLRAILGDRLRVTDGRFSDLATAFSRESDVTVALVGEHPQRSGENHSTSTIDLPAGQFEALAEIAALGRPLVVVVHTGRPLALEPILALADAVVVAWHPGTEAGSAVADLLLGEAEPTGRLPVTFPKSTGHIPYTGNERPSGRPIPESDDLALGRYVDALTVPALPLGAGLSYTTFEYGAPVLDASTVTAARPVRVSVEVTNIGDRRGREVVQLSVRSRVTSVTRPVAELATWGSVELEPGESRAVTLVLSAAAFEYWGRDNQRTLAVGPADLTIRVSGRLLATVGIEVAE